MNPLRLFAPPLLAMLAVLVIDHSTRKRGLLPPGFRAHVDAEAGPSIAALVRWGLARFVLWAVLWIGVFSPLGAWGLEQEIDLSQLTTGQLFLLHLLFVFCLVAWYLLGFGGLRARSAGASAGWAAQLGFRAPSVTRELGIGLAVGVAAWLAVLGVLVAIALGIVWLGREELLPTQPPELIPWIAGLPVAVRLGISLSAGVVEETFFRGFLQPRVGVALSTALFVLAHASYEQPFMLVGVTMLSLVYAGLVHWRQNLWPAIAAHTLFDAVQLVVVIPAALRMLPEEGESALLPVALLATAGRLL